MDGIVSILPEPYNTRVRTIWKDLEDHCGVRGILVTPVPHFSWHVAERYDEEPLKAELERFAKSAGPLHVRLSGLGIFNSDLPVIYASLVKDQALLSFHEEIWQIAERHAFGSRNYYAPDLWMPHITLVFQDVCSENIQCITEQLFPIDFSWEMEITNCGLISQADGLTGAIGFQIDLQSRANL